MPTGKKKVDVELPFRFLLLDLTKILFSIETKKKKVKQKINENAGPGHTWTDSIKRSPPPLYHLHSP